MKKHLLDYLSNAKTHSVRGLRILVEYFHALETFEPIRNANIRIVSVFGSARLKPGNPEYEQARKLGRELYENGFAVVTGASQGIMEAANQGVVDGLVAEFKRRRDYSSVQRIKKSREFQRKLDEYSLGLKISLPFEPNSNPHLGSVATFHYFMVRKFFFANLSSAFVACEGGWGTRDELYEMLTLVQTGKMPLLPIIYISKNPAHLQADLNYAIKKGYIDREDLHLIRLVTDYRQAVRVINHFYAIVKAISYDKHGSIEVYLQKELAPAQQKTILRYVNGKYKKDFKKGVRFYKNKVVFSGYSYRSYGLLKDMIDALAP